MNLHLFLNDYIKSLFIFLMFTSSVFFSSCAGTKQQNKISQEDNIIFKNAFEELNRNIKKNGISKGYYDENKTDKEWQPFSRKEIFNPNFETYQNLVSRLNKQCMKDISETIEVSIQSIYKEDTQASNDDYTSLITNYIQSQTNATFTGNDIKRGKYKTEQELKALDTLSYTLYFNKNNYYNRIENEKQENESDAVKYLTQARIAFATGNLVECLSKMSLCHYSIFRGGRQAKYRDKNGNEMKVVDDLNSLKREISSKLSIEILDKNDLVIEDRMIDFRKGDSRKILKLRIGWDGRNEMMLDEIEVKLVEPVKGNILGNEYTNNGGFANVDIKDLLPDDIEEFKGIIKVHMVPPGIFDHFYDKSDSFQEFENGVLSVSVAISNYSFPKHEIAILTETDGNIDALSQGVSDAIREHGDLFFKIIDIDETDKIVLKNHLKRIKSSGISNIDEYRGYIDGILFVRYTHGPYRKIKISFFTLKDLENNKELFNYTYNGVSGESITSTDAKKATIEFLNKYFHRNVILQLDPMTHPTTVEAQHWNEMDYYESERTDKNIFLEKQSRYHNLIYKVNAQGFEPRIVKIPAQLFDFRHGPRPNQLTDRFPAPLIKMVGNLKIEVIPELEYSNKFNNGEVQITIRKKKWFFFNKSKKVLSGSRSFLFSTEDFGTYQITVQHDGFSSPAPRFRDIHYGNNEKIMFGIKYKSTIRSQLMSAVLPGWGHNYMDRPFLESLIPVTVSSILRIGYVSLGSNYNHHRKQFIANQDMYNSATTPENSDQYKQLAKSEWNLMKKSKSRFIGTFASAIITNILTGIWLWVNTA